jgi:hypothetical protein
MRTDRFGAIALTLQMHEALKDLEANLMVCRRHLFQMIQPTLYKGVRHQLVLGPLMASNRNGLCTIHCPSN